VSYGLFRYIAPEQLPVKYGGLSKDGEFGITDAVTEITVRPAAKHTVEFPVTEVSLVAFLTCQFLSGLIGFFDLESKERCIGMCNLS
jgi:hypothetical protein